MSGISSDLELRGVRQEDTLKKMLKEKTQAEAKIRRSLVLRLARAARQIAAHEASFYEDQIMKVGQTVRTKESDI